MSRIQPLSTLDAQVLRQLKFHIHSFW